MKKHEKLLRAMQDYPAGTTFKSTYSGYEHVSTGVFMFNEGLPGDVIEFESGALVYEADKDEWAEVVKPSFDFNITIKDEPVKSIACHSKKLDGTALIHVNNEQEFRALMNYYRKKGWNPVAGTLRTLEEYPYDWGHGATSTFIEYGDAFASWTKAPAGDDVIPFKQFAKLMGIKLPKVLIKSEDGVDMYEGSPFYGVSKIGPDVWQLDNFVNEYDQKVPFTLSRHSLGMPGKQDETNKIFSTKAAAEAWIKKQNEPNEIIVVEGPGYEVIASKDGAKVRTKGGIVTLVACTLSLEEVEHIYTVLKELNR